MRFKKVYVEITNICNKDCSFCSKGTKSKREMSIKEFNHILKEIKPLTNYIYLHVKGEPLIHSKFNEILNCCKEEKIFVNITTNGTVINKKVDDLIKYKDIIKQINLSMHSFKDDHYLKRIFDAVDEINRKTKISVVYRFWALKNNSFSLENKIILKELACHYNFSEEIKDKINKETNIKLKENLYLNKHELFTWPNLSIKEEYSGTCLGLKTHIGILSDGTVIPCCLDSDGINKLGNIFEKSINAILNNKETKQIKDGFRNNKRVKELCTRCSFYKNSV